MRAALLLLVSGCSFFAAQGPHPAPGPTKCNLDGSPFVTDAITSVGAALAAGITAFQHGQTGDVLVPIGISGLFGVSSVYGFTQVHRCRAEHKKRPEWSLEEMPAVM